MPTRSLTAVPSLLLFLHFFFYSQACRTRAPRKFLAPLICPSLERKEEKKKEKRKKEKENAGGQCNEARKNLKLASFRISPRYSCAAILEYHASH